MTKTAKLNLTFLILAIFSIGGSYAYVLLTNGWELPIYADLLVAQLLILLPAWGYTKKEHINLYKEIVIAVCILAHFFVWLASRFYQCRFYRS